MYQVEFSIPATTDLLPAHFILTKVQIFSFSHNWQVGMDEGISICFLKTQKPFRIFFICRAKVVIEYSTDATRFITAVPVNKILIALFLIQRIQLFPEGIHCLLQRQVEMFSIFFKNIIG